MYVSGQILKLRCMTTLPLRGYPNFTITRRVGLWARANLNQEDRQDRHLGSKEQWPDEGPSPVYSKRIAM